MMSTGIVFPSDQQIPLSTQEFDSLEDYQSAVGGYIEAITVGDNGMSFFANDEAKLTGLEFNRRATIYWWVHSNHSHDLLYGDVVLVGPADRRGATLSVPESLQLLLFTPSTYAVEVKAQGADSWQRIPQVFGDYFVAGAWGLRLAQRRSAVERIRVVASP